VKKMNFQNKKILVVGDSILDVTLHTEALGVSLESPTLKVAKRQEEHSFGGAANVVENLLSLGARCSYITPVGADEYEKHYDQWNHPLLNLQKVTTYKKNNVKTRIWVSRGENKYKYLQINQTDSTLLSQADQEKVIFKIEAMLPSHDIILLVDYGLGIFSAANIKKILSIAKKLNIPSMASSQISDGANRYPLFVGATYMCMNENEAQNNYKDFAADEFGIDKLSTQMKSHVCVTLGNKGSLFKKTDKVVYHKGYEVDVVDTCGAGDSFLAAFALNPKTDSMQMCNLWAALSTTHYGTKCSTLVEFDEFIRKNS